MAIKIVIIAAYALTIIGVGILGLKKVRSFSDFLLGGGKVGPWMTAFSYGAAYFSAVLFIGFAGKIGWGFGYSGVWIGLINALVGTLAVWWILGWKVKEKATEMGVSTMNGFLQKRYNSKFLHIFSSLAIFIFLIPYTAAVFMGLSYLFTANFGIAYWQALLFMGFFTALYLVLGGYRSMAMIDVIFSVIMIVGAVVLLFSTIARGNGLGNITAALAAINPKLTAVVGPPGFWPLFSLIFLTSVAPFAMPQLVQKFYAVKDKNTIKRGMIVSTLFAVIIGGVAYFVGATGRVFLNPQNAPTAFDAGKPVFDRLMPELLTNVIPASLSILMLLLILSASMSTLAALVLISGSTLAQDVYAGYFDPKISDRKLTLLMRCMSAFFVLLSVILALFNIETIVTVMGVSWGAIGSTFLGPFVWGLLNKKVNKVGAISSSVLGLSTCLLLYYIGGMSSPEAGTIGMLVSLAVNPAVSFIYSAVKRDA